ncbi:MAG: tRNA pseudouridine(55) synthase TruB, partial [Clostridiales bacterium]|nr:tRNA pseudouridine(55) synthase TruB [Clostridiales bacterium]
IGHTGTLDPMATGVLPVCTGRATRLSDYIMEKDKVYVAGLTLGARTDTQDGEGRIISRSDAVPGREEVNKALRAFTGEIMQTPPMYSAIKMGGKKLYEYARAGQEIIRQPRRVTVYELELLEQLNQREYILRVHCSKGTYIRTICADLGDALGAGGYMSSLVRTRAGCYNISDAFSLEQIEKMAAADDFSFIRPMDEPLKMLKRADVRPEFAKQFLNGGALLPEMYISEALSEGERARVYLNGGFSALSVMSGGRLKVLCLLA